MPQPLSKGSQSLHQVIFSLRRRRLLFLSVSCAALVIVALFYATAPRLYTATSIVEFQNPTSSVSGLSQLVSATAGSASDALTESIDLQTQTKILESDNLALSVIQDLSLEKRPEFAVRSGPMAHLLIFLTGRRHDESFAVPLPQAVNRRERVLKVFRKHLGVQILAGTRLVQVSYTSPSPEESAEVVNRLVQALNDFSYEAKFKASTQVTEWLEAQLADLRKSSQQLQTHVAALQKRTGLFGISGVDQQGRSTVYSPTLDRLQKSAGELSEVEANRIVKQAVYQAVQNGDAELISQLSGTGVNSGSATGVTNTFSVIESLRAQQSSLEAQIAHDATIYGSAYPKLVQERASLLRVNKSLADEIDRIRARAKNDYDIAMDEERSAKTAYGVARRAAATLNDRTIDYTLAKREADSSESLYEDLLHRLEEAGVLETLHASNLTVVDPARAPARPSSPDSRLYLLAGCFAVLLLGVPVTQIAERVADLIVGLDDINVDNIPLFGTTPLSMARVQRTLSANAPLEVLVSPNSSFSESIRQIRSSLLLSRSSKPPQRIVVTSGSPFEGKSTLSSELAGAFAQMDKKVLLVDADLRRGFLGDQFGVRGVRGLSTLLTDEDDDEAYHRIPGVPNLTLLPAGPKPPLTAELLGSPRMAQLFEQWSIRFDIVIVDSAPVLPIADTLTIASLADAVVLVVRSERTRRSSLANTLRRLAPFIHGSHHNVFGLVLNGISKQTLDYYGYGGDYYHEYHMEEASK